MATTDAAESQRLRVDLGRKGMEVNEKLTRLLASQNTTMATVKLPQEQKPGEKPEEKLRRFLDQIIRAQRRLGTKAWGLCTECGAELPAAGLRETPWLELCNACGLREA
jgi:RNA polymerase-binding transcription factor DksA